MNPKSVEEIRNKLGFRAIGRKVTKDGEQQQLREAERPYLGRLVLKRTV